MTHRNISERFAFGFVLFAALMSGAASLAYEVVWSRMLVITLGNSSDATAMVLSSFMLGIAIGALLLGKVADRVKSPLRMYAGLELLLALFAFIIPSLIDVINGVDALRGSFETSPGTAVLRLSVAGLLVVVPSLVMGATIPILVRALSTAASDVKKRIGLVYGLNTIGAALGSAFTGFLAIPSYGFTGTSVIAAGLNIGAAVLVLTVRRFLGESASSNEDQGVDLPTPTRGMAFAALLAAATSGVTMLSAEVLWARVLTFVFGHDTYAFAALLAIVLLGLGVGGVVYRKLSGKDPLAVTALLTGLLGVSVIVSYWAAATLVTHVGRDPFELGAVGALATSLRLEFYREILYTPILVFVPAVISGALFPAACALYTGPLSEAGQRIGTATLINGVGSAIGSLVTSFVLVAWIGIHNALVAAALFAGVAGAVIGGIYLKKTRAKFGMLLYLPAVIVAAISLMMPASLTRTMLKKAVGERHQNLLFYEEGRTGTVSVTRNTINAEKQLFMNAVNEVTTRLVHDQSFKLLGHLGPLLHPNPQNGAMVCLGAGLSAGAALVHPLASLDVVELSNTIPKAAALWAEENNDVLNDDRFKLHIADGRHYLLSTQKQFDVIMVDSTHPKAVDSWILYTREFYNLVKRRLKEDGIAVQWLPLHGLSEREFKIIVRTFYDVFPHATVWANVGFEVYGQAAYLKLVAQKKPLKIDFKELDLRLKEPRIAEDLAPFGMDDIYDVLDCFLAGPKAIDAWTAGLPVQSDDQPIVPYTTKYSSGRRMTAPLLLGVRSSVMLALTNMGTKEAKIRAKMRQASEAQGFLLAGLLNRAEEVWPDSKKMGLFRERLDQGRDYYLDLAKKYEDNVEKIFEVASLVGNLGYPEDAKKLYQVAHEKMPDNDKYAINLALTQMDLKELEEALILLRKVVNRAPEDGLAHYNLGVALNRSGNPKAAVSHFKTALEILPSLVGAKLALGEAYLEMGRLDAAEATLLQLNTANRFVAESWDMLGLIAGKRGDWDGARDQHIRALSLEPYRADFHYNLGIALEESGRLKEAASAYQAALRIDPKDAESHNNLGLVFASAGLLDQAVEAHIKALDAEPHYPEAAYNLGLAYAAQNKTLQAAEAFGIALNLNPNLEPAKEALEKLNLNVKIDMDGGVGPDVDGVDGPDVDGGVGTDNGRDGQ